MYALIIAGGEGERLRPLTLDRPKPMLLIAGRPILEHQIEWLAANGVRDIVILCRYKASVIRDHLGEGARLGVRIRYSLEKEPLGRGGALKQGWGMVPRSEAAVLALNGDVLTNQPLDALIAFHERKRAAATVMLSALRSPYGIAGLARDGRITSFQEKPVLPYWVNAGIYVLSGEVATLLPERGDHEVSTFPALAASGRLYGFRSKAYWRPVDSLKDLSEAERELAMSPAGRPA